MLNTVEPFCIDVTPTSFTQGITVSYTSSGVDQNQISFTAT